jgi:cytochrome c1
MINYQYKDETPELGVFMEKAYGKYFSFRLTKNKWATDQGIPHEIDVLDGVRYANVMRTVAYVCVDEDAEGNAVMQKWNIKRV